MPVKGNSPLLQNLRGPGQAPKSTGQPAQSGINAVRRQGNSKGTKDQIHQTPGTPLANPTWQDCQELMLKPPSQPFERKVRKDM